MGKRKRRCDLSKTPSPTDPLPPPRMDALSKQMLSHQVDNSEIKSFSLIMDIIDDTSKVQSSVVHHRNIDQTISSKHPHHYYGRYYTRRKSANKAEASTSCGRTTPFSDGKMSLNPASRCNSNSRHDTESKQNELQKPERVASGQLATNASSFSARKMFCGLCQKPLRKKRYMFDNSLSSGEPSVVAVLVCGHLYHADCFQESSHHEDVTDPPCPICRGIN